MQAAFDYAAETTGKPAQEHLVIRDTANSKADPLPPPEPEDTASSSSAESASETEREFHGDAPDTDGYAEIGRAHV